MIVIKGFGRGIGGALLFSLPLLMTMELWRLAVTIDRWQLAVLIIATVALTIGLTRTFGTIRGGVSWRDATIDAGVAILAGTVAAGVVLTALSIVHPLSPDPPSRLRPGAGRNDGMPFCCGRIDLV